MVGAKYVMVHKNFVLLSVEPEVNLPNPRKLRPCAKYFSGYIRQDGESFSPTPNPGQEVVFSSVNVHMR